MLGQALPDFLKNKPELYFGLDFYYESFWRLDSGRLYNELPRPISWQSMVSMCEYYDLDFKETEDFVYIMNEMDSVYLNFRVEEYESKSKSFGKST